jgi:hypothetical protein
MSIIRGSRVRFTGTFTNLAGTASDPTTVLFKYELPSGTQTTLTYGTDAALVKSATGVYYVELTLATVGTYSFRWEGSGTLTAVDEGSVVVARSRFD